MAEANPHGRLEAFSDAVFAIAITLLVIELAVPEPESVETTTDLWVALVRLGPRVFSFVLSFLVILITWVNHAGFLRLVDKSTHAFVYANGLLLFTVAIIPFPTALLGQYVLTDRAAPAVVIYNAVIALQAVAWILLADAALRGRLTRGETSMATMRANRRNGYFAVGLYSILAVAAFWLPVTIAAVTTLTWVFWLVYGIRVRHDPA